MSVDMYVSSSQSQASSVVAICRQQKQGYEQLQRAINDFVVGSPQLQGAAYDSAKQFFNAVLMPLSKGGILLSEAVMEACQKFPEEYMASVDSGDLKESELREKIDQLNRQMSELSDLHDRLQSMLYRQQQEGALDGSIASRMSGAHSLMATYGRAKQKLQEKLDKLLDFNGRSPDIFSEIDELKQSVKTGTGVANVSWNSSLGTFTMPKSDKMGWATAIADSWLIRENKAEGIDPAKVEELKDYDIYAKVIYDVDGKPKVFWQLMKDGKGIKNKELYRYLKKTGEYLDPNMFEFISLEEWDKMVKEGFKNGINIENGDEYKGAIKGIVATSQAVENVYTWTTESELAQALQILGFTYASYRIASMPGKPKFIGEEYIDSQVNEVIAEPKYIPKDVNGNNLKLPRYENGKMVNGTSHIPDSDFPHSQIGVKKGRSGEYIQTLEWGEGGKPIQRTDWTDHGRGDHVNPHSHEAKLVDGSWSFKE